MSAPTLTSEISTAFFAMAGMADISSVARWLSGGQADGRQK